MGWVQIGSRLLQVWVIKIVLYKNWLIWAKWANSSRIIFDLIQTRSINLTTLLKMSILESKIVRINLASRYTYLHMVKNLPLRYQSDRSPQSLGANTSLPSLKPGGQSNFLIGPTNSPIVQAYRATKRNPMLTHMEELHLVPSSQVEQGENCLYLHEWR